MICANAQNAPHKLARVFLFARQTLLTRVTDAFLRFRDTNFRGTPRRASSRSCIDFTCKLGRVCRARCERTVKTELGDAANLDLIKNCCLHFFELFVCHSLISLLTAVVVF